MVRRVTDTASLRSQTNPEGAFDTLACLELLRSHKCFPRAAESSCREEVLEETEGFRATGTRKIGTRILASQRSALLMRDWCTSAHGDVERKGRSSS
jgi:hypothetical protein